MLYLAYNKSLRISFRSGWAVLVDVLASLLALLILEAHAQVEVMQLARVFLRQTWQEGSP